MENKSDWHNLFIIVKEFFIIIHIISCHSNPTKSHSSKYNSSLNHQPNTLTSLTTTLKIKKTLSLKTNTSQIKKYSFNQILLLIQHNFLTMAQGLNQFFITFKNTSSHSYNRWFQKTSIKNKLMRIKNKNVWRKFWD